MYVRHITETENRPFGMMDSTEHFKKFGEGIYFYFCFLKYFTFIFFIMSLCIIPVVVITSTWDSSGLEGDSNYLVKASLGNLVEMEYYDEDTYEEIEMKYNIYEEDMRYSFLIFHSLDLTYSFLFLLAIIVFKIIIIKKRKIIEKETLTVQKYSLLVSQLPEKVSLDELRDYFEGFGKVVHANGIFNFYGALKKIKSLAKCELKKADYLAKLDKSNESKAKKQMRKIRVLDKKILKLNSHIRNRLKIKNNEELNLSNFDGFKLMKVFITFDSQKKMKQVYMDFNNEYNKGRCKCCVKVDINERYYFKGHKLKISIPDLPSNINWENIGYSFWKKTLRMFGIIFFISLLLIIGTTLILAFTSLRETKKETMKYLNSECYEEYSIEDFLGMETHEEMSTFCFCSKQSKFTILNNSGVRSYCYDYLQEVIWLTVMRFLASFLITLVDIMFAYFVNKIIRFVSFLIFVN
jgi:RNA recognition motif-containing protein